MFPANLLTPCDAEAYVGEYSIITKFKADVFQLQHLLAADESGLLCLFSATVFSLNMIILKHKFWKVRRTMSCSDVKVIDLHSDIWVDVADKRSRGETRVFENKHLNMLKANNVEGLVYALFTYEKKHLQHQPQRFIEMLAAHFAELNESSRIAYIRNTKEYEKAMEADKFVLFGMVEGLYGLEGNTDVLYLLKQVGISVVGFIWSEDNEYGTCCNTTRDYGLTSRGIQALKIARDLNFIIDVSHMSEASFWDVEKNVDGVFIASHSNCYSLCPVSRNLKDDQIKAIAEHDGVIGLVAWPDFVDLEDPTLDRLIDHGVYIAELVGPEHLALGLDFAYWSDTWNKDFGRDGKAKTTKGIEDVKGIPALLQGFEERGFSPLEIKGIAGGNFLRVFKKVCG